MHAHPSLPRNNNLKRISFIPPLPKPRTLIVIIASQSAYWRTTTTRPHPPFPRGVFISGHGDLQKGFIRFHFLPKTRLSLSTCRLQGPAPEDRVPAFLPSLKATSNHKKGANKKSNMAVSALLLEGHICYSSDLCVTGSYHPSSELLRRHSRRQLSNHSCDLRSCSSSCHERSDVI